MAGLLSLLMLRSLIYIYISYHQLFEQITHLRKSSNKRKGGSGGLVLLHSGQAFPSSSEVAMKVLAPHKDVLGIWIVNV